MKRFISKFSMTDAIPLCLAIFLALWSIATFASNASNPHPQDKSVLGEQIRSTKNDPVTVGNIEVRAKTVSLDEPFEAEDEWLKDLSFKLHNRSGKAVTYIAVDLAFPETAESGLPMLKPLQFGQWPGRPDPKRAPLLLKPNETLDVSLDSHYASLKRFLETRQPIDRIKKIRVSVYALFFEDGTKWSSGVYFKPDTASPTGYSKVETSSPRK